MRSFRRYLLTALSNPLNNGFTKKCGSICGLKPAQAELTAPIVNSGELRKCRVAHARLVQAQRR